MLDIKIHYLYDLTKDSFNFCFYLDNTFLIFKSVDDLIYFIYINTKNSITSYDIINNQKICEINNAHKTYISNFSHYIDKKNKIDLFISICGKLNNIEMWNIKNWECILNIQNIYEDGAIYSTCFLNDNNLNYII